MSTRPTFICFAFSFIMWLLFTPSIASSSISDLSIELIPNGPSFLAPGTFREIEVVIRNAGPDATIFAGGFNSPFRTFPIGEVDLLNVQNASGCSLRYTDLLIPPNQEIFFSSFILPTIEANAEYRCTIRILAIGRGVRSYSLQISTRDIGDGAIDPNPDNNSTAFIFSFEPPGIPLTTSPFILAFLSLGIALVTWRHTK